MSERVVVFSKRDLVPEWGIKVCSPSISTVAVLMLYCAQPFQRAMASKFPDQKVFFASWNRARDIRALSELLVSMSPMRLGGRTPRTHARFPDVAKEHPYRSELNVLVVGMPNVGKSTLLNALRNIGIAGREFGHLLGGSAR